MWTARIKLDTREGILGQNALKHQISIFGFPLSYHYEKNWIIVNLSGKTIGDKQNITKFKNNFKKELKLCSF